MGHYIFWESQARMITTCLFLEISYVMSDCTVCDFQIFKFSKFIIWSLTETQEKSLNGTYTRMLRKALNIHWSAHVTNENLYGKLPPVSSKIAARRLQLAGHCFRHPELSAQKLILWEPSHGQRGRGRPRTNYVDTLKRDTGATDAKELASLMEEEVDPRKKEERRN